MSMGRVCIANGQLAPRPGPLFSYTKASLQKEFIVTASDCPYLSRTHEFEKEFLAYTKTLMWVSWSPV